MAITFHTQPQVFTPGSNPVVWTFSSNQTYQANFSYIVEFYISGILHSTHQVFQQSGIYAKFNASEIMRGLLSSPLITDGTFITLYESAYDLVRIIVYEQYGTPPAIVGGTSSGTQKTIFNAALRHQDFVNWDYQLYNVSTSNPYSAVNPILFLTSWPRTKKYLCGLNEKVFLGFITNQGGTQDLRVRIRLYNSANSLIVQDIIPFALKNLLVLDVSPQNIIDNSAITSGNFSTCVYYDIMVSNYVLGTYPSATESFKIYIDTECQRYPSRRLHWLNKFGVWDSFTFDLVSTDSTKVEGNRYEKEKGIWSDENYIYPLYQGEGTTFSKRAEDTLTLNSDWIKEDVQQWLVRELYESPKVYLESDGSFEPVNVTNASYKLKVNRRDGLIQELVEISRTYSFNSQLN
jgi:hypothetical protein